MFEDFKPVMPRLKIIGSLNVKKDDSQLQRTEDWLEQRKGRFTGSKLKDLMGCGKATSKQSWGTLDKLVDFGAAAETYIYSVGKERTTGIRSMEIHSKQMNHGKDNEDNLIQQLLSDGLITDFKEHGFVQFKETSNGGASPDGECTYKNERVGLELKCCVSWDGHKKRMYEQVHEKHDDFWQFQGEMLAMGVDKLLYVVAMPMQTKKYDFAICHASPLHQKQLIERIKIADSAIANWKPFGYKQALLEACADYKENNKVTYVV